MAETVVHLSSIAGSPLLDTSGEHLGKIEDVVVRLDDTTALPAVVGLVAHVGGRQVFVPMDRVEQLERAAARTATTKLNLAPFERRPGEVLLHEDVLDRSLINVQTARLVKARDVELVNQDGTWRVAGVDPTFKVRLYRLLPRRFRGHDTEHKVFVPWEDIEPFVGHVPTSRRKLVSTRLRRLHPAQIADLVEAASHDEGQEILEAVSDDKELEADVFEELDDEHQAEFLRERSDEQVAEVLSRVASDDAADLLLEIQQERRIPVLNLLAPAKQAKIRSLLGYNPSTAGGLMNPDFVEVALTSTVAAALEHARASALEPHQMSAVCIVDEQGQLVDAVTLADLIRAEPEQPVSSLTGAGLPSVHTEADLPEVARLMADYNLLAMPVVDHAGMPVGLIAVDDVLERLVPEEWRRRAGAARD